MEGSRQSSEEKELADGFLEEQSGSSLARACFQDSVLKDHGKAPGSQNQAHPLPGEEAFSLSCPPPHPRSSLAPRSNLAGRGKNKLNNEEVQFAKDQEDGEADRQPNDPEGPRELRHR